MRIRRQPSNHIAQGGTAYRCLNLSLLNMAAHYCPQRSASFLSAPVHFIHAMLFSLIVSSRHFFPLPSTALRYVTRHAFLSQHLLTPRHASPHPAGTPRYRPLLFIPILSKPCFSLSTFTHANALHDSSFLC